MYKNILIPVLLDADHVNTPAFDIARVLGEDDAQFSILHVMENLPAYATAQISAVLLSKSREAATAALDETAKKMPGAVPHMISGHAGRSIVEYAKKHEVDCIVITSHTPGLEDYLLGSTASRVVRHAKCAVHVIR